MPLPVAFGAGAIAAMIRGVLLGVTASFIAYMPQFIARVMAGLGLYFVVAKPVTAAIEATIQEHFSGIGGKALETLFYLNVDDYAVAIISAHAIAGAGRMTMKRRTQVTP